MGRAAGIFAAWCMPMFLAWPAVCADADQAGFGSVSRALVGGGRFDIDTQQLVEGAMNACACQAGPEVSTDKRTVTIRFGEPVSEEQRKNTQKWLDDIAIRFDVDQPAQAAQEAEREKDTAERPWKELESWLAARERVRAYEDSLAPGERQDLLPLPEDLRHLTWPPTPGRASDVTHYGAAVPPAAFADPTAQPAGQSPLYGRLYRLLPLVVKLVIPPPAGGAVTPPPALPAAPAPAGLASAPPSGMRTSGTNPRPSGTAGKASSITGGWDEVSFGPRGEPIVKHHELGESSQSAAGSSARAGGNDDALIDPKTGKPYRQWQSKGQLEQSSLGAPATAATIGFSVPEPSRHTQRSRNSGGSSRVRAPNVPLPNVNAIVPRHVTPTVHVPSPTITPRTPSPSTITVRTPTPSATVRTPSTITMKTPTPSTITTRTPTASTITVRTPTASTITTRAPSTSLPAVRAPTVTIRVPTNIPSDRRLKRDIVPVGRLANGLRLYRYRYLWSDTVYVGVMAQEVLRADPRAVARGSDGTLRVDYGRIGARLMTWDEWRAAHPRGRQASTRPDPGA
jgi:hypothetical protein